MFEGLAVYEGPGDIRPLTDQEADVMNSAYEKYRARGPRSNMDFETWASWWNVYRENG